MNGGSADVRSIDALREWVIALANYRSSAEEVYSGLELEIRRAYDWLEDQGKRWKVAVKECEEEVTQAKSALSSRKFEDASGRMPDTTIQERDLRRAKARLEHAEEMVEKCRSWLMKLPKIVEENYTGASRRMRTYIEADLPVAMAGLERRIAVLDSYAELQPDFAPAPSVANLPSADAKPQEPQP